MIFDVVSTYPGVIFHAQVWPFWQCSLFQSGQNVQGFDGLVATVTGSVTGERRISDDCYGCVDLSGTSNKTKSSFLGLLTLSEVETLEKVLVSEEKKWK